VSVEGGAAKSRPHPVRTRSHSRRGRAKFACPRWGGSSVLGYSNAVDDSDGNPRDTAAPDLSPPEDPPRPPLDEPAGDPEAKPADRLSKQVPIGLLFTAAAAAIVLFLLLVAAFAYFALAPER
jgi:hypothetical protein